MYNLTIFNKFIAVQPSPHPLLEHFHHPSKFLHAHLPSILSPNLNSRPPLICFYLPLDIRILRFIHVVACISSSFLFVAKQYPYLFFSITTLLRFNSHTIKSILLECTLQWFFMFTKVCTHHYYLLQNIFVTPQKKFHTHQQSLLFLLSLLLSQPQATTNVLSVSMDLPILEISYKWNCTIYGFLSLASFTQHHIFKVHPYLSMY